MLEIRINLEKNEVVMTRKFADKASNPRSNEYRILQDVIQTYPNIHVRRHTIKKNPNKECYRGLTYDYMRHFIVGHETKETVMDVLEEFNELLEIAKCHSKGHRYPVIKKWFLEKYTEVAEYGIQKDETETEEFCEVETIEDKTEEVIELAAA